MQPDGSDFRECPRNALLTEQDIARCFDGRAMVQARELLHSGRVAKAQFEPPCWLIGSVGGTGAYHCEQVIGFGLRNGAPFVEGRCSCDKGTQCAHVAAVVLAYSTVNRIELQELGSTALLPPTDPAVESWLKCLEQAAEPKNEYPTEISQRLIYVLKPGDRATLTLTSVKLLKDGGWSKPVVLRQGLTHTRQFGRFMRPVDIELFDSMARSLSAEDSEYAVFRLEGRAGDRVLKEVLGTGRCHFGAVGGPRLALGPARQAEPGWTEPGIGIQQFTFSGFEGILIPLSPPWYSDPDSGRCGPLETGLDASVAEALLSGPPVLAEHSAHVRRALACRFGLSQDLLPEARVAPSIRQVEPIPRLRIDYAAARLRDNWGSSLKTWRLPSACLTFTYGGIPVTEESHEIRAVENGEAFLILRNSSVEAGAWQELKDHGWTRSERLYGWSTEVTGPNQALMLPTEPPYRQEEVEQELYRFVAREVPGLRKAGWRVDVANGLRPPEGPKPELVAMAMEKGADWFDLQLGVRVGDQLIDLRPILASSFDRILRTASGPGPGGEVYHRLDDGRLIALPIDRLRPILQGLLELFGRPSGWGQHLRLPTSRAGEVAQFDELAMRTGFEWQAPHRLGEIANRLAHWEGVRPEPPPANFRGELREYQLEGFGWLNFLADFGFGGILADDMGLGKTVQTLAHILAEKAKGRLTTPALVVAPTSTLPNWMAEISRFAPELHVLKLHGSDRAADFDQIPHFDLILTSYPLLARDGPKITRHDFHLAVLDEAQNIKNHNTHVAKAAFEIRAHHRVALSGTPIENHVQELWSIFRFALPGLLGNAQEFRDGFRIPIEKNGDKAVQSALSRRIRPFILRRTKGQVATELPPKTIIVDRVELEETQRDLYESVRLAMDERIRRVLAAKGLDRSRIEVLDALLKLRQVCCDPRLVKLPSAAGVTASAKLERLMEMLSELLEEGRRVLLFSQFTSMLDLIEPRLRVEGIEFVRLSGDTQDRATPVNRFQKGEVPLFLISLKAGGTGLNLTAADTVIHYDPWWNPAVENQATDRAHRIGQDKPVFVFKLVATDTVEEKILELQARKADLADRLLAESTDAAGSLSADDLRWILE